MNRSAGVLFAVLLAAGLVAVPALAQETKPGGAPQIKPVGPGTLGFTTPDGTEFRFGTSLDFQPMALRDLNFNRKLNFRAINEFGALGEEDAVIGFENRLFFTATKGLVSLYTAIELDGVADERSVDANNPNIERVNLSLLVPPLNTTFTLGWDIYAVDQIGGLVYIDDDPGIWFKGGAGPWSWQAGWHKRQSFGGGAGDSNARFPSRVSAFERRDDDTNIFSAKVGYDFTHPFGRGRLEPFAIYYLRNTPMSGPEQTRLGTVGPEGATRPANDPLQANISNIQPSQETWYVGLQGTGSVGWLRPSFEVVGLLGHIQGLRDRATGARPFGRSSFNIRSLAAYGRLDFDWSKQSWWPLRGIIPFAAAEFLQGDGDPSDKTLKGFVSPSAPTGLRAGDFPLYRKTFLGLGASPLFGNGSADFGFEVTGRGTGPTIGNIFEGGTFASAATFNNRFGKGDNPGYIKLSTGLQGSWNPQWDFHLVGSFLRFHKTDSVEAEFRSFNPGAISSELGGELSTMVVYKPAPRYQVRPFFSVFIPGAGAQKLAGDNKPGIVSGVDFFASF